LLSAAKFTAQVSLPLAESAGYAGAIMPLAEPDWLNWSDDKD